MHVYVAVERAYSLSDKAARAFLGKYRSPVALEPCVEFLPDLVPHSSLVQLLKDFCDAALAINSNPLLQKYQSPFFEEQTDAELDVLYF